MLVVEAVTKASPAQTLDIWINDRLLTYNGQKLLSPTALLALEENTFGAQRVALRIARDGIERDLSIPTGKLGLIVRPELPDDMLLDYDKGREAFEAERFTEAALRWSEAADRAREKPVSTWLYSNAGEAWEKVPDWQHAREVYTAAWKRLQARKDTAEQSWTAMALGRCSLNLNDYETAVQWYKQAHEQNEIAGRPLWAASALNNLGVIALPRGDLQAAQDYHVRALQIRERLAPNSLDVAESLTNLGLVALKRGDPVMAQDYHMRALAIYNRSAPGSLNQASVMTDLGQTLLYQQQPNQALPYLQQAVQILERQRSAINSPEARALLLAPHTPVYAGLIQCQLAHDNADEAFSTLERTRARSLRELLVERRLDFTAEAPSELLRQQQELDRLRSRAYDQLARVSAAEGEQEIQAMHAELRDIERTQHQLTAEIRQTSPRYASLQYPQALDCKAAQRALQLGALLLAFVTAEEHTFLFALTRKTLRAFTLSIELKSLQRQVRNFRAALNIGSMEYSLEEVSEKGKSLYDQLLAPAQAQIRKATRLLLCPDGPLHTLPWAALVTDTDGAPHYLGEWKPLHTTLSMTVYAQMREEGKAQRDKRSVAQPTGAPTAAGLTSRLLKIPRKLLAFGDPIYTGGLMPALARSGMSLEQANVDASGAPKVSPHKKGTDPHECEEQARSSVLDAEAAPGQDRELAQLRSQGLTLSHLPHSREEVEAISRIFGEQAVVKLGAEATKTAALQESADMDIVHFACHGWLDSQMPLSSALVLSQPELLGESAPEGDNGLLQAWEILSKMRLKAELVVLSACQTALGQEVRGEGLMGLTRALTYAGARSVLTSLWEINDASTSAFMQAFYSALVAGQDKAKALRSAMQQMRRYPQWADPFFWSAFLLAGDAD